MSQVNAWIDAHRNGIDREKHAQLIDLWLDKRRGELVAGTLNWAMFQLSIQNAHYLFRFMLRTQRMPLIANVARVMPQWVDTAATVAQLRRLCEPATNEASHVLARRQAAARLDKRHMTLLFCVAMHPTSDALLASALSCALRVSPFEMHIEVFQQLVCAMEQTSDKAVIQTIYRVAIPNVARIDSPSLMRAFLGRVDDAFSAVEHVPFASRSFPVVVKKVIQSGRAADLVRHPGFSVFYPVYIAVAKQMNHTRAIDLLLERDLDANQKHILSRLSGRHS